MSTNVDTAPEGTLPAAVPVGQIPPASAPAPGGASETETAGGDSEGSRASRVLGLAFVLALLAAVAVALVWRQRENKSALERVKRRFR